MLSRIMLKYFIKVKNILRVVQSHLVRQSFSLNDLDLKLTKFINIRRGFFVEVGANDGLKQSNSLYFEKYLNWRGLLIEPIPDLAEKCRVNRPSAIVENCALVSTSYPDTTIQMRYNGLMSIVKGSFGGGADEDKYATISRQLIREGGQPYIITVPARTLSALLDYYHVQKIDLFSLDVEGYELEVLQGLDFTRHAPTFLLIEMWHKKRDAVLQLLAPYYVQLSVLYSNDLFADVLFTIR